MPVRPFPRCLNCNDIIHWWTGRGTRPIYCCPGCKDTAAQICARCRKPLKKRHIAQRYHDECNQWDSCRWCGRPMPGAPRQTYDPDARAAFRQQHEYCSWDCRDKAWEGQSLPICYFCNEPVTLERGKKFPRRDPPKAHRKCYNNTPVPAAPTPAAARRARTEPNPTYVEPPKPKQRRTKTNPTNPANPTNP